jgi:transposase-like protein
MNRFKPRHATVGRGNPKVPTTQQNPVIDDETRYWIAQEVAGTKFKHDAAKIFRDAKETARKIPNVMITDGLPAYHDAFNREFYPHALPHPTHINAIKITSHHSDANNNKMESINGEIRDGKRPCAG